METKKIKNKIGLLVIQQMQELAKALFLLLPFSLQQ